MSAIETWSATPANNTDLGGVSTDGSVTLVNQLDNMLRGMMAEVRVGINAGQFVNSTYAAKSGGYTAVVADRGKLLHFTASATLTLTAAATLTAGWWIMVRARGGIITIDPNSTETINGALTKTIADGDSALIFCDGSNFLTVTDYPAVKKVFTNYIHNGDFDIWQRGVTQTASGYGSDDRWTNAQTGSTKTHTRQTHTLGQTDVPGNPQYYSRTVVTSVANAANNCLKAQAIERVKTLSGKTVTVTFWAKADSSKNIAIEFIQNFGTGGSPSSVVTGIGAQLIALTTSWVKKSVTVAIPSISGKTIGTAGDDYLQFYFWFDAGSNFNSRTASLGQQSGTFEISHVSIVEGDSTTEADPFEPRSLAEELTLCQRFYQKSFPQGTTPAQNIGRVGAHEWTATVAGATLQAMPGIVLATPMRTSPTVTFYSSGAANAFVHNPSVGQSGSTTAAAAQGDRVINGTCTPGASTVLGNTLSVHWSAEAEF